MEAIIFCGIQATGKSTFYVKNFFNTHMRISLDMLNTRNKENIFLDTCFKTHQRFVIDNTNPTQNDRYKYMSKAKKHKYKVIGFFFQSSLELSNKRNQKRKERERIEVKGIEKTLNKLEEPTYSEGFDELYNVVIKNNDFFVTPKI
jgi:predicted kinase